MKFTACSPPSPPPTVATSCNPSITIGEVEFRNSCLICFTPLNNNIDNMTRHYRDFETTYFGRCDTTLKSHDLKPLFTDSRRAVKRLLVHCCLMVFMFTTNVRLTPSDSTVYRLDCAAHFTSVIRIIVPFQSLGK